MTIPTKLPAKPTFAVGRTLTPPALADVQTAIDAAQPGDTVLFPNLTLPASFGVRGKNDITLKLQGSTKVTGGTQFLRDGFYIYQADRIRITGDGSIVGVNTNGIGIYSGSGHVIDGALTISTPGAMGILVNASDGTVMDGLWIEGVDIANCGNATQNPSSSDPEYWKYGLHGIYFGGGRAGHASGVIVGCHIHDQPNGYGCQLGGQAQEVVFAGNLVERVTGASAGGPVSDRNARGVQVYSSYSGSKDVLVVSNVCRDCPGASIGSGPPDGIQGVVRSNVQWRCGPIAYAYGAEAGLTDGGGNSEGDYATVASALSAGKLDPAFVLGTIPPPPPPPPPPSISGSIKTGQTLSGLVQWTADNGPCVFAIDGGAAWTENNPPYVYLGDTGMLDTKTLADGSHVFVVAMVDGSASFTATASVRNGTPDTLPLTVVTDTATKLTLSWTPPADAVGYGFFVDGTRVSTSSNGAQKQITFAKKSGSGHVYEVRALANAENGKVVR